MKTQYLAIAIFILLSGCQIEQHRREQALGGVELSEKMGKALTEFRAQETAAEESILDKVKIAGDSADELSGGLERDEMARVSASSDMQIKTIDKLKEFVYGIAKKDSDADQKHAGLDAEFRALISSIPSTEASIMETQKSFAELAKPLPLRAQFNETKSFVADVEKNYNDVIKPKLGPNKNASTTNP